MQSNNNNNNNNNNVDDGFKLASKRNKKTATLAPVPVPDKPIIICEHCQKLWHTKDKCFTFITEQENLERLKTTECVYCHKLGHTNSNCSVSKANAEKKAQIVKKQQEKEAKFNADFPIALSFEPKQKQEDTSGNELKYAWASVAMANRDPKMLKKIEEEDVALKKVIKKAEREKREEENRERKQKKLAVEKAHWYKIRPVILALKTAFPKSWIHKVDNTPYDIKQASDLRDEEACKRLDWEFEQERLEWEENERWLKESRQKEAERDRMTPKELDEDYRQAEEEYEDAVMNEENLLFSRIFSRNSRFKTQCSSCIELLEDGNLGSQCIGCIFQLGPFPMKI